MCPSASWLYCPSVLPSLWFVFRFCLSVFLQDSGSCRCDQNANTSENNRNLLSPCQPISGQNPHLQLFPDSQWEGWYRLVPTVTLCFLFTNKINLEANKGKLVEVRRLPSNAVFQNVVHNIFRSELSNAAGMVSQLLISQSTFWIIYLLFQWFFKQKCQMPLWCEDWLPFSVMYVNKWGEWGLQTVG